MHRAGATAENARAGRGCSDAARPACGSSAGRRRRSSDAPCSATRRARERPPRSRARGEARGWFPAPCTELSVLGGELASDGPLCTALPDRMQLRMGRLDDVDLTLKIGKKKQLKALEELGDRLQDLRLRCGGQRGDGKLGRPVCVLFEGW